MSNKTLLQKLGVNSNLLAGKCSGTTKLLLQSKLLGGGSTDELLSHMEETFNKEELMFLAIGYITDKTESMLKDDSELSAMLDRARIKHNIPVEIADFIKDSLGIRRNSPN